MPEPKIPIEALGLTRKDALEMFVEDLREISTESGPYDAEDHDPDDALRLMESLVRELYAFKGERPVIYIETEEGVLLLDVWAEPLVSPASVVVRLPDVIDLMGEEPDSETVAEYLPELQKAVDERAAEMRRTQ